MKQELVIQSFNVDSSLMYLIQHSSKHKTQEILAWFHAMMTDVLEGALEHTKSAEKRWVRKELKWIYEGTEVPFRLVVSVSGGYGDALKDAKRLCVNCDIGFPRSTTTVDVKKVIDTLVETQLGLTGATDLPDFEKPKTKVPNGLRRVRKMKQ